MTDEPNVVIFPKFDGDKNRATQCLLCGAVTAMRHKEDAPKICDKCKRLWKFLKEKYGE